MRKVLIALAIMGGMFVAMVFMAAAPSQAASSHVPGKVCASERVYTHLHSRTARQCKRQGFFYDIGQYPVSTDPWTFAPYVLVWGPHGRLWVDTAGFYTCGIR